MRLLTAIAALLICVSANAIPMSVGDIARIDYQASDWSIGGGGAANLLSLSTRMGFCGVQAQGVGTFSGNSGCDLDVGVAGDQFRLSIFSTTDQLLFSNLSAGSFGTQSPNTAAVTGQPQVGSLFPLAGYVLLEVLVGAFDLNEVFLLGVEATAQQFSVQTPRLGFSVTTPGGGSGSVSVPEPTILSLLSIGLLVLGVARRCRRYP